MTQFDDNDKTVADFNIEEYNKQYHKDKEDDEELEELEEFDELEEFEELEEFDEEDFDEDDFDEDDFDEDDFDEDDFDEEDFDEDDFDEEDFDEDDFDEEDDESFDNDDFDDIEDDIFDEDSIIQNFNKKELDIARSPRRKSRKKKSSGDKTVNIAIDQNLFSDDEYNIPEGDGDKTEIFNLSDFEDSPKSSIIVELARLKIIEGIDEEDFSIQEDVVTVGRGADADIIIKTNTLSRVHFQIKKGKRGFKIKDLNSSNGISINDKKVSEKRISSGDIITAGKIKFKFIDMQVNQGGADVSTGSVVLRRPESPNKKKLMIIGGAVGVVLLLLVGGLLFMKSQKLKKAKQYIALGYSSLSDKKWDDAEGYLREATALKPTLPEIIELRNKIESDQTKFKINKFFSKGITAYKNKEWKASLEYFNEVLKYKPDYKDALSYKKQVEFEVENQDYMEKAKKDLIKEDFQSALLKLRNIKESSAYYSQAQELMELTSKKNLEYLFKLAEEANSEEDYTRALDHLNNILQKDPDFDKAQALKKEIDEKILTQKEKPVVDKKPKKWKAKKRPRKSSKYKKAFSLYTRKNFDGAIKLLQKQKGTSKINKYISNIRTVQKYMTYGDKFFKKKDNPRAIRSFLKALSADSKVNKAHSGYIRGKLGKSYLQLSKGALMKKQYPKAYRLLAKGKKYGIPSGDYNSVLGVLRSRAKTIYLKAYQVMAVNPDAAKRDFKLVIGMLPSNDNLHKKAKVKLASIK